MSSIPRRSRGAILAGLTLSIIASALASPLARAVDDVTFADDFARPAGTDLANGWTEKRGDWVIEGEKASLTGATSENLLVQTATPLGNGFALSADYTIPAGSGSQTWGGLTANVRENAEGGTDFYVFRITYQSANARCAWQVLQATVGDSGSFSPRIVGSGYITDSGCAPGNTLQLRMASVSTTGDLIVGITRDGAPVLSNTRVKPGSTALYGGHPGLYIGFGAAGAGTPTFDNVSITTSATPATPPAPAELTCTPEGSKDYTLAGSDDVVLATSEVDETWAGAAVPQALLTHGTDQYVGYYDENKVMTVAHRKLGDTAWQYKALDSTWGGWDVHNAIVMAIDTRGQLHVSGNMHGAPMTYFRTTAAGDISTLTRVPTLVDATHEQSVTYPTFITGPGGDLVFTFRDGSSGNGSNYYYAYDADTQAWRLLLDRPLFDGEGKYNAYPKGPTLGPDGKYHVVWVWRETGDAATNSRLSYMRSSDLTHWETADGQPITVPLTYDQKGVIIDDIPSYGGLLNGLQAVHVAPDGQVRVAYHKYDDFGSSQIYLADRKPNASAWSLTQLTHWTGRWDFGGFGSLFNAITLPFMDVLPDGNIRVDFTCNTVPTSMIIDPGTTTIRHEVPTPPLVPADLLSLQDTDGQKYPGAIVRVTNGAGTAEDGSRYVMRWEAMQANQDRPRPDGTYPSTSPLRVYRLGPRADAWQSTATYDKGAHVTFEGSVYVALWRTKNETPGSPSGPWAQEGNDMRVSLTVKTWTNSWVYRAGDLVVHEGRLYRAAYYSRNQSPDTGKGAWVDLGPTG